MEFLKTRQTTPASEKLAKYARSKALQSDVANMVARALDSHDATNHGIFFEGDTVVIATVIDKTYFFQVRGMTREGLETVMLDAAARIADARGLPPKQEEQSPATPSDAIETDVSNDAEEAIEPKEETKGS